MNEQEARARLIDAINAAGGQRAFANQHHFTVGYVHDVIYGKRALADRIARAIGLERITVYQEARHDNN
jgi:hypothetical protein